MAAIVNYIASCRETSQFFGDKWRFTILQFAIFYLLLTLPASAQSLPDIRARFAQAVNDADGTKKLLHDLQNASDKQPILFAYRGAAEALMARHVWNPYTKMAYLKKSQRTLAEAIRLDPDNAEMRFLRFSIQHYVPAWLGYSPNLDEDRKAILRGLPDTDPEVRRVITRFLLECDRCTPAEIKTLRPAP